MSISTGFPLFYVTSEIGGYINDIKRRDHVAHVPQLKSNEGGTQDQTGGVLIRQERH